MTSQTLMTSARTFLLAGLVLAPIVAAQPALAAPAHQGVAFSPRPDAKAQIVEADARTGLTAPAAIRNHAVKKALVGLIHTAAAARAHAQAQAETHTAVRSRQPSI